MDIITYALSKKIAAHALSGVQSMSINGQTLIINTKDSGVLTMTFPTPKDGVSVADIDVNANNQIVFTMSDGTEFISGNIPTVKGDKGDTGFSPTITENADNTDKIYKLDITTADSTFTTPNLKGADGTGGEGASTWSEISEKPFETLSTDFSVEDGELKVVGGTGEENTIESISVNGTPISIDENKNVDITVPKVTNDLTDELKSSYDDAVTAKHTHDNKTVLDSITAEKVESWDKAEENIQPDWNEIDDTADGFIKNKPTIPDITGLATETYVDNKVADYTKTVDLADVATSGSYNDLTDKPTIPSLDGYAKTSEIPSKVSELENDSNYLSSIPEEYVTDAELESKGYLTEHQDISGKVDRVEGKSLISDTEIARLASVDNYDDTAIKAEIAKKADATAIPSKVSELTNDSNYQTAEQVNSTVTTEIAKVVADAPEDFDTLKEMSDWIAGHEDDASAMNSAISDNKTAITALQTGKADKNEIPTTVAELTDSANYAKKTDIPITLPANGGNSATVNNHTVKSDVPENAVFTDTTYSDATQIEHGLMSVDDKKKLDGLKKYTPDGTTITADEDGTLHGVAKITVDTALSSTSTNPVQNKVIAGELKNIKSKMSTDESTIESNTKRIEANETAISTLNGTGDGSVKKAVSDGIAKVVAGAPEDFDTLKEMSDWISSHESSASAMNTQIQNNKEAISGHVSNADVHFTSEERTKLKGVEVNANKTVVDDKISDTSVNPVQNKVITAKVKEIESNVSGNTEKINSLETEVSNLPEWSKSATKPTYTKEEVGLGNVDNTADANKSVKYATSAGNATKVNNHTVNADVPSGAKFTDTTYGVATTTKAGIVKPDGTTITADEDGTLHGVKVTVDDALSPTSTNPVQNKVVKAYVDKKVSENVDFSTSTSKTLNGTVEAPLIIGKATRNLLNPTLQTTTQNGITCTNNGDGTYIVDGTATAETIFVLQKNDFKLTNKTLRLTGCPISGGESTYHLYLSGAHNLRDYGSGATEMFTKEFSTDYFKIMISSGCTCNNLVFKPMLTTDLSATYDDFVPYSGYDIKTCGKNIVGNPSDRNKPTVKDGIITFPAKSAAYEDTYLRLYSDVDISVFDTFRVVVESINETINNPDKSYVIIKTAGKKEFSTLSATSFESSANKYVSNVFNCSDFGNKIAEITVVIRKGYAYLGGSYKISVFNGEDKEFSNWVKYVESSVHIDSSTEFPLLGLKSFDGETNIISSGNVEVTYAKSDSGKAILDTSEKFVKDARKETTVNLLNPTLQTTTQNGVTCTNNGDGTYTFNGTATSNVFFDFNRNIPINKGTEYKAVCFKDEDYVPHKIMSCVRKVDTTSEYVYGNGSFVPATENCWLWVEIVKNVTVSNLVAKPMITTNLSATYDDFVPYTGDTGRLNGDVAELQDSKADKTEVPKLVKVDGKTVFLSEDGVLSAKGGGATITPKPTVNPQIKNDDKKVVITWEDPTDTVIEGSTFSKWAGTKLVMKESGYPTSPDDGTVLVDNTTRDKYKTTGFEKSGLTNDKQYYFALFPYSTDGVYNSDSGNRLLGEPTLKIVTFAGGTDAEIAKMIQAHYNNEINVSDYWAVGDTRSVSLSAMSATGVGESHRAQTVQLVILGFEHDDLATAINGHSKAAVSVGLKDCLMDATSASDVNNGSADTEKGYMNSTNTNVGGWKNCARRTWCNNVFFAALPSTWQSMVKTVNKKVSVGNNSSTIETVQDKIFLVAEIEIFGSTNKSFNGEGTQYQYYKNATANKYKMPKWNSSGVSNIYWERSPFSGDADGFCYVNLTGRAGRNGAYSANGVAPCLCI